MPDKKQKHYFKILKRIFYLLFLKPADSNFFVKKSYDHVSSGYDNAWTNHNRFLTESLIERLAPKQGDTCLDLTCGTGYATNLLSLKTQTRPTGVDISQGMLTEAEKNYGKTCNFIQSDILEYLRKQTSSTYDVITCCWGLGYSKPFTVLKEVKRVLKKGGKIAIIDNSLFSLKEILYCSFLAFAQQPDKLTNLMRFNFLTGKRHLYLLFKLLNTRSLYLCGSSKSYTVKSGLEAIDKLISTGAAAGFEYAADPLYQKEIFDRFAEIIEQKYMTQNGIVITHRYLAGIAQK
jgi:ubiquinone/menaquinone biosynthesis C-methylase UbiE